MSSAVFDMTLVGSFTLDPVKEVVSFWMNEHALPADIALAPYGQLFPQLLAPAGFFRTRKTGLNVVIVRLEDWLGTSGAADGEEEALRRNTRECVEGLRASVTASVVPHLVVCCPPSPAHQGRLGLSVCEAELKKACNELGAAFVGSGALVEDYALEDWHSEYLLREAHIPYTRPALAAIGTAVARHAAALLRPPCKVVVLDCDHTIWGGVCAEDGPGGVVIDAPHRELQARMRALRDEGVMLCLCSKNEERDVLEVFAQRGAEMPLSIDHISARRIGWGPKGESVRRLAAELNVGLDSVVVLDDSPIECAEIASACPEATVLRVPHQPAAIQRFLRHCWAFDRATRVTAEDKARADMMAAARQRDTQLAQARSLEEFIAELDLQVAIDAVAPEDYGRVSQLSLRTNQFNLSGRRRSEAEVRSALEGALEGLVVRVRDRFGDYGLVGTALYLVKGDALTVDSLFVSCRALGRGVEHRMLAELGRIASGRGCSTLVLPFVPTARNAPARRFLEEVAKRVEPPTTDGEAEAWRIPAAEAAALVWRPTELPKTTAAGEAAVAAAAGSSRPAETADTRPAASRPDAGAEGLASRIALELNTGAAIARAVEEADRRRRADKDSAPSAAAHAGWDVASTPLQRQVAEIFSGVLGIAPIALDSDFFELGGHSLLATALMARIASECGVELPLHRLFETPTPAGIARAVEESRSQDARDVAPGPDWPPLAPDPQHLHDPFPLTPLQAAYWVGRRSWLGLGNVGTHNYVEFDYDGLDLPRYEKAWRDTIARHPMLRAVVTEDGRQRVLETVPDFCIPVLDLREQNTEGVRAGLESVRAEMESQVLRLDAWPTFDIRACLLPGGRTRIHTSFDGLMVDLWSTRLIAREVALRYVEPSRVFPPLPVSFRDFVLTEEAYRSTPAFARAARYWEDRLDTLPPAPDLPLAREPQSIERSRFARLSASLDADAWARLAARARRARLTGSGLLLAVFAEVLERWSKSPRFTVNLTLFHRPPVHPLVNELVGDFTSLVMLEFDGAAARREARGFGARARRVQEQLWRDLQHRAFTGVELLRELARRRGLSAASMPVVFTSALSLDLPHHDGSVPGFRAEIPRARTQTPQVWLDHQVFENEGVLEFNWDYVPDLFPAGMVEGMFESYCDALKRLADEEDEWQAEAGPVELPARMRATRAEYNATDAPVPEGLLHAPFERQAERAPERVAVIDEGGAITYGDLLARARHVAHRLRALGARPNTLVAVCARKGIEQVAGVLGVLMSGAAYLPVDADLPAERIHHLMAHGEVRVALSHSRLSLDLPHGITVLNLDEDLPSGPVAPLPPVQSPADLAYVIYTSGSTGLPKGVMISHRAALNTVVDINERFTVRADDRVLAVSSLSFDLSVWDIFGLLAVGGTVVMPSPGIGPSPGHWVELLARHGVTLWNSVPALVGLLVEHAASASTLLPESLRLVMMSGDWIPLALPGQIRTVAPSAQSVSLGGATEAAIWSILYPIGRVDPAWTSIPYGRPMRNQRFYVFDHALRERPDHVPGQLYIGGEGVALGYWRDEERTRERFITAPGSGERLYWTGDLGRRLEDATIEFLGREDFQVKIQGYRVELGEIEAVLTQHPSVRRAVVAAVGERDGARRLVAYLVANDGAPVDLAAVRLLAGERLPRYMVPSAFAVLPSLPLTSNGKVDRKALPPVTEQEAASSAPASAQEEPTDPLQQQLLRLWRESLGVPSVQVNDDFFALGGHSLVAVRLCSHIERQLGVRLPMTSLFEAPTVRAQAERLRERGVGVPGSVLVALKPEGTRPPFFLVHGVSGAVPTDLARHMAPDQPLYGLQAVGLDGTTPPLANIPEMARRYLREVREVQPHGPYCLGGYSMGGAVALDMCRQLLEAGEQVAVLIAIGTNLHENRPTASLAESARRALQLMIRDERLAAGSQEKTTTRWRRRLRVLGERLRHLRADDHAVALGDEEFLGEALAVPGAASWPEACHRVAGHNLRASVGYTARPCPVRVVLVREQQPLPLGLEDRDWGWSSIALGGLEVHSLPARYDGFLVEPLVRDTAALIEHSLPGARMPRTDGVQPASSRPGPIAA